MNNTKFTPAKAAGILEVVNAIPVVRDFEVAATDMNLITAYNMINSQAAIAETLAGGVVVAARRADMVKAAEAQLTALANLMNAETDMNKLVDMLRSIYRDKARVGQPIPKTMIDNNDTAGLLDLAWHYRIAQDAGLLVARTIDGNRNYIQALEATLDKAESELERALFATLSAVISQFHYFQQQATMATDVNLRPTDRPAPDKAINQASVDAMNQLYWRIVPLHTYRTFRSVSRNRYLSSTQPDGQ